MKLLSSLILLIACQSAFAGWQEREIAEDPNRPPQVMMMQGYAVCTWPIVQIMEYVPEMTGTIAKGVNIVPVPSNQARIQSAYSCQAHNNICPKTLRECYESNQPQVQVFRDQRPMAPPLTYPDPSIGNLPGEADKPGPNAEPEPTFSERYITPSPRQKTNKLKKAARPLQQSENATRDRDIESPQYEKVTPIEKESDTPGAVD